MNELALCRTVQDSIHGPMAYTQEELDIADHPLFQRLRYIYQTGVLYLVAHAATHRRFEHSLGVVATAQKLLNALWDGSHRSASKLYTLDRATRGQAVRFDAFPAETRAKLQRLTRLCALVHDLGHGPLSHTFDAFAPRTLYLGDLLLDERLAVLRPYLVHTQGDRLAHEVVSCLLFAKIWHDLGGEPWVAAAVACVLLEGMIVTGALATISRRLSRCSPPAAAVGEKSAATTRFVVWQAFNVKDLKRKVAGAWSDGTAPRDTRCKPLNT
jgi:hypothetical protein